MEFVDSLDRPAVGLLQSFVVHHLRVGSNARRLGQLADLPPHLRRHVGQGSEQQYFWFAWELKSEVHLITGELLTEPGSGAWPTLRICRYTPEGGCISCGLWHRVGFAEWQHGYGMQRDRAYQKASFDEIACPICVTQ